MHIELKNLKISEFASEETRCFQATVYLDGRRCMTVSNDGHGGCNYYQPLTASQAMRDLRDYAYQRICKHVRSLPDIECEGGSYKPSIDSVIDEVMYRTDALKRMRRALKARVHIYRGPEEIYSFKAKPTPENIAAIRTKNPDDIVLNGLDETMALGLWVQQTYETGRL
jgi:hypothetical protein